MSERGCVILKKNNGSVGMLCVVFRVVRLVKMAVSVRREETIPGCRKETSRCFRIGQRPLLFGLDNASNATSKIILSFFM